MRISISALAWDRDEDDLVSSLLQERGIDAVDLIPSKYFPNLMLAQDDDVSRVRSWWIDRGIEPIGMQALLHGTNGLNLFSDRQTQTRMIEHLRRVCQIGNILGARRLVFGSPKSRDRSHLDDEQAREISLEFFWALGQIANSYGVIICLEPNPTIYGANFLVDSAETSSFVSQLDHPSIKMQLDTGSILQNKESIGDVLRDAVHLVGHVHISEPNLAPLKLGSTTHTTLGKAISRALPEKIATIEMLRPPGPLNVTVLDHAISEGLSKYH